MFQNRVTPSGQLISTPARGTLMGNRGVIHNELQQITHAFKHKAWISCVLEFKDRKRKVMTPGRWTELFFLDEATAFAAGHRPCFECRREDAMKFKSCWIKGNPQYHFNMKTSVREIDEVIHRERIDNGKNKVTWQTSATGLPDGTFVLLNGESYLINKNQLYHWTPFGYDQVIAIPISILTVLTPKSIVKAFSNGYLPKMLVRE